MKTKTKKLISYIVVSVMIAVAAVWIYSETFHPGNVEFTDNAQIRRQIVPVNCRVQGYIREIRFKEYSPVKKGDTLVVLDDSDLLLQVAKAQADYEAALAGKGVTGNSVNVASAQVGVSEASVKEAKVVMDLAYADYCRFSNLLAKDAVTRQQFDAAKTDYEAKKARYDMLLRQKEATGTVVSETRSRIRQNDASLELAEALLSTARLNHSYTVITAPCNGYTSRMQIQVGELVQPGQTLLDIVDSDQVWIEANFKETQTRHIVPGARVDIRVDALPDVLFKGRVVSLSGATGSSLSILPQDNSAGNFVKVRQRVPVRIEFTGENRKDDVDRLSAGMNVECEVNY